MTDLQRISGDEGFGEHTLSKPELMSLEDRLRDLIDLMDCHVTYVEKSKSKFHIWLLNSNVEIWKKNQL